MRSLGRPRGHAALFVLATVTLGAALVLAGVAFDGPLSPGAELALSISGAVGLAALAIELRHDDHDASMFGAVAAFLGILVFGVAALAGRRHPIAARAGLALSAAAFVGAFVHLFRLQRARELVPDVLGEAFGAGVVETDGVQWFVVEPEDFVRADAAIGLEVYLQNGHEGVRDVVVHAEPERGLLVPLRAPVRLAPLEVGVVTLPLQAMENATREHVLRLWLEARGGGRRVRRQRRTYVARRLSPVFRFLGVVAALANPLELARVLRNDHGVGIRLTTLALPGAGEGARAAEPPSFRSVWRAEGSRWAARSAGLVR